jgi:hypothetical protein
MDLRTDTYEEQGYSYNHHWVSRTLLGWVTVPDEAILVEERGETACRYRKIQLTPGKYPVWLDKSASPTWVLCRLPGSVTESYQPNLYGGVPFSKGDGDKEVGNPATYGLQLYDYNFAGYIQNGGVGAFGLTFTLDNPNYQVTPNTYTSAQGETRTMYRLTKKEVA